MPTHIRPATVSDVPQILQFIGELAAYEKLAHEVTATESLLHEHLFGANAVARCLIAELDNQAVGFALYFYNFSTFMGRRGIYLEDLFVRPEARGKGIGRALLAQLGRIAVKENCGRVEWAVLDWNTPAIGFYKKLGAAPMHEWTVFRVTGDELKNLAAE
jgi:GNAT superfamily N-acetyltransferase